MRTTILLLAAILGVGYARGQSAQCTEATKAAINYRDFVVGKLEERANRFLKQGIQQFGINMFNDEEIEQLMCSVVDAEEKTIAYIARHNPVVDDERQLAFAYSSLLQRLQDISGPSAVYGLAKQIEFYNATGYPNFPLKISGAQLSKVLSDVDLDIEIILKSPWRFDADDRDDLLDVLNTSTSLEEFVRQASRLANFSLESEEALEVHALTIRRLISTMTATYHHRILTATFLDVLEKTGFMGVTRGGPELSSCDFIADTAVEALEYVVELAGTPMVQQFMTDVMGVSFTVDDTCAVRAWVCAVVSSKTQTELVRSISENFVRTRKFGSLYQMLTDIVGYVLSPAVGSLVGEGMSRLRLLKIVVNLKIPLTEGHARQFAALIKACPWWRPRVSCSEDELAQLMEDADSLEGVHDAVNSCNGVSIPPLVMERLQGKTDSVVLLVSSLYQLAMSAEELGLFMLPLE